ncbi:mycothione reductase [Phycicoccus sonneratiae]|uniref:Mycothione reductase n=1 Tax=Phycicoccus sonneratiae TaxID=2807628 RepID=A0ABS2CJ46_9MICO|nr:mycothione reductase [Phycicoccus sonneraticus]MBM6399905.1 mycothione reductase [Phycicoccus sonneraticus]
MPHHDLVIIGSGSGNSLLTPELEGLDVAIVEKGTFGGTCLNVGCIPTKMFVLPADRVVEADDAHRLGVAFDPPHVDWPAIRDRVFGRIDPISRGGEDYRRGQDDVTLYRTRARFTGPRALLLDTGEELTAERVVVAAGSRAVGLAVDGLTGVDPDRGVHTSDTVMRMDTLPPRMIVVGGGFVACEMAHVFSSLGVRVTQVQRSARLLMAEEQEISQRYTDVAREHYDVRLGTKVTTAERVGDAWRLTTEGPDGGTDHLEAEVVLLAVGRRPNTDLLDAAAGGLETHPDGRLVVDAQQRTSVPKVWALGDISSEHQLKHVANGDARIVAHNLAVDLGRVAGPPREQDDRPVPHAVFGHPQVASFGPTAEQLRSDGTEFVSYTQKVGDVAYGWALEDTTGLLTVHAAPDGRLLAAHMVGPQASSIIQPLVQAASFGQHAHDVARGQYWIHPALAEVVENALLGLPLEG